MSGFGIASEKVPTMKSLDSDKKAGKSGAIEEATANDNNGFFKDNAKIDFSNVKVEPLFEEEVDFDTFSKSDFRAVKVKECIAVPKSKKLLQFTLDEAIMAVQTQVKGIVGSVKTAYDMFTNEDRKSTR